MYKPLKIYIGFAWVGPTRWYDNLLKIVGKRWMRAAPVAEGRLMFRSGRLSTEMMIDLKFFFLKLED